MFRTLQCIIFFKQVVYIVIQELHTCHGRRRSCFGHGIILTEFNLSLHAVFITYCLAVAIVVRCEKFLDQR